MPLSRVQSAAAPLTTPRRRSRGFADIVGGLASLDARSLALLRLTVATLTLVELGQFAVPFTALLADAGLPPADAVAAGVLVGCGSAAGSALLVGYRSRFAALVAWLALLGLGLTRITPLTPADALVRLLLAWCVLLPTGTCYSVDRALRWSPSPVAQLTSFATAGFLIQAVALTTLGGRLLETSLPTLGQTWSPQHTTLAGAITHAAGWPNDAAMALGWTIECAAALLIVPLAAGAVRTAASISLAAIHAILAISVGGAASATAAVTAVAWIAVLPTPAWDALFRGLRTPPRTGLTLWHGGAMPPRRVRFLRTFLLLPETRVRSTHEDVEHDVFRRQRNSWIVTDWRGYRHLRFRAFAEVVRASPLLFWLAPLLRAPVVETVGDWIYDLMHRPRPGSVRPAPPPRPPSPVPADPGWERWATFGFLLILTMWQAWITVGGSAAESLVEIVRRFLGI